MIWGLELRGVLFRSDVLKTLGSESGGFQAGGQQIAHDIVGEKFHTAIGVVNDEEFAGAEQFVADDERADGVVAGSAAGAADDGGVAFGEACILGGIETSVQASENGAAAGGRESQIALLTEIGAVNLIRFQHF